MLVHAWRNLSKFLVTLYQVNEKLIIGFSKTDARRSYKTDTGTTAGNNCKCFLQESPSKLRAIVLIIRHNQKFLCFFARKRESPGLQIAQGQKIEQRLSTRRSTHVPTPTNAHVPSCTTQLCTRYQHG